MSFKEKIKNKTKNELVKIKGKKEKNKLNKNKEKEYHQKILDEIDGTEDDKVINSRISSHNFMKLKCDKVLERLDEEIVYLDIEINLKE